jgi:outer membrane protein TolC
VLGVSVAREGHRVGAAAEGPNYIVLGTLGVALPLWQQNQGERARARADEHAALIDESATRSQLRARIASAHAQLTAADERVRLFATRIVPRLEESLALLQRGFEAGEISLVSVAVARERFLLVQRDGLASYADYYRSRVELEYLIGASLAEPPIAEAAR